MTKVIEHNGARYRWTKGNSLQVLCFSGWRFLRRDCKAYAELAQMRRDNKTKDHKEE